MLDGGGDGDDGLKGHSIVQPQLQALSCPPNEVTPASFRRAGESGIVPRTQASFFFKTYPSFGKRRLQNAA